MFGFGGSLRRSVRLSLTVGVLALTTTVGALAVITATSGSTSSRGVSGAERQRLATAYGRLPLSFEPNRGQSDPRVRFLTDGPGYGLFFTSQGPVLTLRGTKSAHTEDVVRLRMLGASTQAPIEGLDRLQGTVSYLTGSDRSRWRKAIPTFSRVRYRGAWPGVNVDFYGNGSQLEYDLRLAPGADPAPIGFSFTGARSLRLEPSGALAIGLAGGAVRQLVPRAYQVVAGRRVAVPSAYSLSGRTARLRLGGYDRRLALVVDPTLSYSTYLGGSGVDAPGLGIAVDSTGAAYVTGGTQSTDFPTTPGAYQTTKRGSQAAFVSKLAPDGKSLSYSTLLGGSGSFNGGAAVAVDSAGAAYVLGATSSTDFPTTSGAFQTTYRGFDSFVTKLSPDGSSLDYSSFLGGSGFDFPGAIAVDSAGAAYVTGNTQSTNFPVTSGAFQTTKHGGNDAFVTKVAPDGKSLSYSTYLGGSGSEQGLGIAVDAAGNAYVTGSTGSTDFPHTAGAFQTTLRSTAAFNKQNAFVTKLSPDGSALVYSTYLGGSASDLGFGVAVDSGGAAYVNGNTSSSDFPTTSGAYQTTNHGGSSDDFVSKLAPDGASLSYSTFLGGSGTDVAGDIAVDSAGKAWVAGYTSSSDFPTTSDAFQTSIHGGTDLFVSQLSPDGANLSYSTFLGGSGSEIGGGIAVDSAGAVYVDGNTLSSDFPTTPGAFQTTEPGGQDPFVTKFAGAVPDADLAIGSPPADITTPATGPSGAVVTYTAPAATDEGGESPGVSCSPASGSTFPIGTTTVNCTASDSDDTNSPVSTSFKVTVNYVFSGFLPPVNNPPTINTGHAGRTYPVKFQLQDTNGDYFSSLSAVKSVTYKPTSCSAFSSDPTDTLETSTTGGTSLTYDSTANQYVYNWATPGPGCYTLFLTLDSGQVYPAYFNFS